MLQLRKLWKEESFKLIIRHLESVQKRLNRYNPELYVEMKDIFTWKFSPEVCILEFAFLDTVDGVNVLIYTLDDNFEEVLNVYGESCFAGSEKVFENINIFNAEEEVERSRLLIESPEILDKELDMITRWFDDAFEKAVSRAGVPKCGCVFTVGFDDEKYFDLKEKVWKKKLG